MAICIDRIYPLGHIVCYMYVCITSGWARFSLRRGVEKTADGTSQ